MDPRGWSSPICRMQESFAPTWTVRRSGSPLSPRVGRSPPRRPFPSPRPVRLASDRVGIRGADCVYGAMHPRTRGSMSAICLLSAALLMGGDQTPPAAASAEALKAALAQLRREFDAMRGEYDARIAAIEAKITTIEKGRAAGETAPLPPVAGLPAPSLPAPAPPQTPPPPPPATPTTEVQVPAGARAPADRRARCPSTAARPPCRRSSIPTSRSSATSSARPARMRSTIAPRSRWTKRRLAFQAVVDPYARADFFLAFGQEGVEVEEGYITFTTLPEWFLSKVGKMQAQFGKVNTLAHARDAIGRSAARDTEPRRRRRRACRRWSLALKLFESAVLPRGDRRGLQR